MRRAVQLIFLISVLAVFSVYSYALDGPAVKCQSVSANPGETVDFVVLISDNPGVMAWQMEVSWDNKVLEYEQASVENAFSSGIFQATPSSDGLLKAIWCTTQNVTNNGRMLSMKMKVKSSAKAGTYPITISFVDKNTIDEDGNPVFFSVIDGSVTVKRKAVIIPEDDSDNDTIRPGTPQPNSIDDSQDYVSDRDNDSNIGGNAGSAEPEGKEVLSNPFRDVSPFAYYYDAVLWASSNGITSGTSADKFSPYNLCSRAQTVTFLWRAAGSPEPESLTNPFDDVSPNSYYYKAVLWAVDQGITKGTTATSFSPNVICSRAQVVTFLWRSNNSPSAAAGANFSDVSSNKYYYNAVQWAVSSDVTSGTNALNFSPDDDCNRAQIATFLYRLYGNI